MIISGTNHTFKKCSVIYYIFFALQTSLHSIIKIFLLLVTGTFNEVREFFTDIFIINRLLVFFR